MKGARLVQIRCNPEAEKQILGYLLNEHNEAPYIFETLKTDHFYKELHQDLFSEMKKCFDKGESINAIVLSEKFNPSFIAMTMNSACMGHQVETLCNNIYKNSNHRKLIALLNTCRHEAETAEEPEEVINKLGEGLSGIVLGKRDSYILSAVLMDRVMANIEGRKEGTISTGIPTGFEDLDQKIHGWQKQHLVFLGAVPKMGKTALALEFANNLAKHNFSALYFTLEMSLEEMGERQLSSVGEIRGQAIATGRIRDDQINNVFAVANRIADYKMGWVDRGGISVTEIKSICRQYKAKHGLDFVVIDQLDKIEKTVYAGENDANAMKRVTTQLKSMAQELDCTVLCLCQLLDKVVSARPIPRPQHGDEKGSSAPSEDADIVMFLWRPEFYFEGMHRGMAELIIARQRTGPAGAVWFTWRPEITKFNSMPRAEWPKEIKAPTKTANKKKE